MDFYLVRHGEAKPEEEDPARPLSDKGREEVRRVASYGAKLGIKISEICHSGKRRARETAEIFAEYLAPALGVREMGGLAPMDEPQTAVASLKKAQKSIMLVGHLPHLSRLTSLLLVGDPEKEIIQFRMGGIVCLTRDEEKWRVKWILTPELVL